MKSLPVKRGKNADAFCEVEIPRNFLVFIDAAELAEDLQWSERSTSRWLASIPEAFVRRGPGGRAPKVEVFTMLREIYSRFRRVTGGQELL